jgi:hypothetical protein
MKNQPTILLFLILIVASCRPGERQAETSEGTGALEVPACYSYVSGNDSIILHIRSATNGVSGELAYLFSEKDQSLGTIQGRMKGDTLFAEYVFMSEGVESVREVAFLRRGDTFIEGYGPSGESNGRMVFTSPGALDFSGNTRLQKVDCRTDDQGCVQAAGYTWSALRNACIRLPQTAIRLNASGEAASAGKPAFLILSEDQQRAEVFLPGTGSAVLMERTGPEGGHYWESGDLRLYSWKGYVLRRNDQVLYAG